MNIILETESGIHLAPANQELALLNIKSYKSKKDAMLLCRALDKVKDYYDFILIDTPPVYGHFIINGMAAADKIFVVLDPGIFALEGVETLKKVFENFFKKLGLDLKIDAALITRARSSWLPWKKNYAREVKAETEKILDKKTFLIPYSDAIYETHRLGKPISHYKPWDKVGKAYKKIAKRLLKDLKDLEKI
tara:strand:- start:138 stop:713 length:576 start_codon:yes stop_codon:yes gene_type:complete